MQLNSIFRFETIENLMNWNFFLVFFPFWYYGHIYRQIFMEEADAMIDEATLQHFILGMMMAMTYPTFRRFKYPYLGLILIHPFIIEGVQFFMPNRTPDTADALVGLVGTLLGFCLV
jgi:VanZ family protein